VSSFPGAAAIPSTKNILLASGAPVVLSQTGIKHPLAFSYVL